MTKVKAFIKSKLQALAADFPAFEMLYACNEFAEAHIVQLTPQKKYYTNEKLDTAWMNIQEEFMQLFPYQNIGFVSDDSNLINGLLK